MKNIVWRKCVCGQVGEGNLRQTVLQMLYHVREVNKASQKSILIFILAIDDVECNGVSAGYFFDNVSSDNEISFES